MFILLVKAFIVVILLTFLVTIIDGSQNNCPTTSCIVNNSFPIVRYPFYLQDQEVNYECGNHPMFNLSCDSQGNTILGLPHIGDFYVRLINYVEKTIYLADQKDCLPKLLLSSPSKLNLSSSPFSVPFHKDYTFFNCPPEMSPPPDFSRVISCLGTETSAVVVVPMDSEFDDHKRILGSTGCNISGTIQAPVSLLTSSMDDTSGLFGDLTLSWDAPECKVCDMDTTSPSQAENSRMNKIRRFVGYFCLVAFVMIPSFLIGLFACYKYILHRRGHRYGMNAYVVAINATAAAAGRARPPSPVVITGLDESTIELYTEKLVVGESGKLQGNDRKDMTCSICLGDYCPGEILRCILECQHCFHAECVDQWLKTKGMCPVCRHHLISSDSKT